MATTITVSFDHPATGSDQAVARVTVVGTTGHAVQTPESDPAIFDVDGAGEYDVSAAVTTLPTAKWSVKAEGSGSDGTSQTKKGTGSMVVIPHVTVGPDEEADD